MGKRELLVVDTPNQQKKSDLGVNGLEFLRRV
jgi:hypothetical protein